MKTFYSCLLLLLPCVVQGYSSACQEAMTMTAMSKISGTPLAQLKRLLHNKDAVDVCHWSDKVALKYDETMPYLYESGPGVELMGCLVPDFKMINLSKKPGLIKAIKHFYTRLLGQSKDHPLTYPVDMEFTDADALRYVIGLFTHLHNPMDYVPNNDHSADKKKGKVVMGDGEEKPVTLYDFYDKKLCELWKTKYIHYWNSGWTHFHALGTEFYYSVVKEFGNTLEENLRAIDTWGMESAKLRCDLMNMQDDFVITPKELDRIWVSKYRSHVLKAGVRLSVVLQKILDHQDAPGLRKGSGVQVLDTKIKEVSMRKSNTGKTILVNLLIVSVVVGVGWYFLIKDNNRSTLTDIQKRMKNSD